MLNLLPKKIANKLDINKILLKNPDYNSKYIYKWLGEFDKLLNKNFLNKFREVEKEI